MNKTMKKLLLAILMLSSAHAFAESFSVKQEVVLNSAIETSWRELSGFGEISGWHPSVENSKITEGKNGQVGAVRAIKTAGGKVSFEKITAINEQYHTMTYMDKEGVTYDMICQPEGSGTKVSWLATFDGDVKGDGPAKSEQIRIFLKDGLDNLKAMHE
jgi:Polyketide cyclase / dehydrase and lipid transport